MRPISDLAEAILTAGIPIHGVALLTSAPPTVRVDFNGATVPQQAQAQTIVNGFDWSDGAHAAQEEAKEPDMKTLRDQAIQAVADINVFLAIGNPTNAQVLAEVRAIDQRQRGIIKALARTIVRTWM